MREPAEHFNSTTQPQSMPLEGETGLEAKNPPEAQNVAVWAAFLATSWTWVIGMVLPVLLYPYFHFWGWLAFAVPNVIGAAAVGFFSYGKTDEEKEAFIRKHLVMFSVFSVVTILFQFFVVSWLITRLVGPAALLMYLLLLSMFTRMGRRDRRLDLLTTMGVLILSLAGLAYFCMEGRPSWQDESFLRLSMSQAKNLIWLSSALALGFLTCPHMDMTLLRARNALEPRPAKWAFGIGFGVLFLAMIVFTLAYASGMEMLPAGVVTGGQVFGIVALHVVLQAAATSALHIGELRRRPVVPGAGLWVALGIAAVAMLALAGLGREVVTDPENMESATRWTIRSLGVAIASYQELDQGEVVYRCFLAFYAFIFPSYAWTCMFNAPAGDERVSMTRMGVALMLGAAAAGIAAVGFFSNDFFWVFPGVVLILVGPGVAKVLER
jgi:hypothetical protein